MFTSLFSSLLITLIACQNDSSVPQNIVEIPWQTGQSFHLTSSQRLIANMTEESIVSLEDYTVDAALQESWSPEIVWTYKVIETDIYPDTQDELYEYSISETGKQHSLTVIKAFIDPTLNQDPNMMDLEPVIYLVFHSQHSKLLGMVQFTTMNGVRVQEAIDISDSNRSYSALSQSNIGLVPSYLAPFGTRWTDEERILEDGSSVYSEMSTADTLDVYFDDAMGGELVMVRYQEGYPFPTIMSSANFESRMLSEDEVLELKSQMPNWLPEEPADFDYRSALRTAIHLDEASKINAQLLSDGSYEMMALEEYRPWAGSWWPLKSAELVFGYMNNQETFSLLIRPQVDPIKNDMDKLSEEIRNLQKEDKEANKDAIKDKRTAYTEKQKELVDVLVQFYTGIQEGLDGGAISIANGEIRKDESLENGVTVPGWHYALNDLSPMDKFAVLEYLTNNHSKPFFLPAWELLNSYNPGGQNWWGHCNGWAGAAILTNEPREAKTVEIRGENIAFTTADLKGLLTEAHYSTQSNFYGERYNGSDDDIADLSPKHFHQLISFYLDEKGVPFVFDTSADESVWNFPVWKVDLVLEEMDQDKVTETVNINLISLEDLEGYVDADLATRIIEYREKNGAIQDLAELHDLMGYQSDFDTLFRLENQEITYNVIAEVFLTTDGVAADFVDTDSNNPESISETWEYTLTVNEEGMITGGEWKVEDEHPDFAWIPYNNPHGAESNSSENPFLVYGNLLEHFGNDIDRQ